MKKLLFIAIMVVAGCTPQKRLVYFQDRDKLGDEFWIFTPEYRVKPGDILHIRVITPDEEANKLFNMEEGSMVRSTYGGGVGQLGLYIYGYTINKFGNIQMPVIGEVGVNGKTLEQIRQVVQGMVDDYLIGATVSVRLVNFSVTVLGEVKSPGNYYVYDNDFTIMDALGLAGDLTDFGNRHVNVVRRTDETVKFDKIDITDRRAINSELYFLQPGDLVYVEPLRAKRAGFGQFPFGLIFSTITTTLLLINFFSN